MRVVIDFVGDRPWAGQLRTDGAASDTNFEGRLDLLRLLEDLVAPAAGPDTFGPTGGR